MERTFKRLSSQGFALGWRAALRRDHWRNPHRRPNHQIRHGTGTRPAAANQADPAVGSRGGSSHALSALLVVCSRQRCPVLADEDRWPRGSALKSGGYMHTGGGCLDLRRCFRAVCLLTRQLVPRIRRGAGCSDEVRGNIAGGCIRARVQGHCTTSAN